MSSDKKWAFLSMLLALGEGVGFLLPFLGCAWPLAFTAAIVTGLYAYGTGRSSLLYASFAFIALSIAWYAVSKRSEVLVAFSELNRSRPVKIDFVIPSEIRESEISSDTRRVSFSTEIEGVPIIAYIYMRQGEVLPQPGEVWHCCGWLGHSTGNRYARRSFWVRGKGSYATKVSNSSVFSLDRLINLLREDLSRRAAFGINPNSESLNLNRALLLGKRALIDPATRKSFANSGTIHLFAISGLHVLVIAKFISMVLALLGFPMRARLLLSIFLLWVYVMLTGASISAIRAGTMSTIAGLAPLFYRRDDALVSWSQTFILVHIISPLSLVDIGSQLSFAVMLGLVVWRKMRFSSRTGLIVLFAPTIVAWLFGVPIIASTFGVVTPCGMLANVIAVPIASFSVVFAAAGVLCSYISSMLAALFNAAASMTTSLIVGIARSAGALPYANFEIAPWSFWECIGAYGLLAMFLWALERWSRRCVI